MYLKMFFLLPLTQSLSSDSFLNQPCYSDSALNQPRPSDSDSFIKSRSFDSTLDQPRPSDSDSSLIQLHYPSHPSDSSRGQPCSSDSIVQPCLQTQIPCSFSAPQVTLLSLSPTLQIRTPSFSFTLLTPPSINLALQIQIPPVVSLALQTPSFNAPQVTRPSLSPAVQNPPSIIQTPPPFRLLLHCKICTGV